MTQTIHVMAGLPASGKTTLARSLGVPRFNLDEYRAMLGFDGENWSKDRERLAVAAMLEGALAVARMGSDIVLDNCHVNRKLPRLYKDNFVLLPDARFQVHDLTDVPVAECIVRDGLREGSARVGPDVIQKLAKDMQGARKGGWRLTDQWMNDRPVALSYVPDESLPKAVGCDLDGTLALHVARGPYEFDKVETDAVNVPVAQLLGLYRDAGYEVLFLSGGKGEFKEHRDRWLAKNELFYAEFHTREPGDDRSDDVVKLEMFDRYVRHRYNFQAMLDDRNRLVRLWRAMGIFCPQVAYGAF